LKFAKMIPARSLWRFQSYCELWRFRKCFKRTGSWAFSHLWFKI